MNPESHSAVPLNARQRYIVLAAAFFGWMGAGMEMSVIPARPATLHFLGAATAQPIGPSASSGLEKQVGMWTAGYNASFLLGAALGGLVFGWAGDRMGRVKAMALSILCYSAFAAACAAVTSLEQLVACRFLSGLGVGGIWPTGVALAMEAWSGRSRALVAGVIGTAANVGLSLMGLVCARQAFAVGGGFLSLGRNVTADDWRWVMLVGATPAFLALLVPFVVPESPAWRRRHLDPGTDPTPLRVVFCPPYLRRTLVGIVLGTIPLLGGWGSINWAVNWADAAGQASHNQGLKAHTQFMRSSGAILGSFCGGWIAGALGSRRSYFLICLGSLLTSGYLFWFLTPTDRAFLPWMFVTGVVATTAFGWLPLYLPQLFPTEVRATGSGVTFNFGRIMTVVGVLGSGFLLSAFAGDYAKAGRVTHLIFAVGMVVILFAPDFATPVAASEASLPSILPKDRA